PDDTRPHRRRAMGRRKGRASWPRSTTTRPASRPVDPFLVRGESSPYPQVMKSFDATRPDFAPYGLTCERWTSIPMERPDRHNEIELNLLLDGSLTYLFGGARVTIRAGSLSAFWAAIPHQVLGPKSLK